MNRTVLGWLATAAVALGWGCGREDAAFPSWEVVVNGRFEGATIALSGGDVLSFTAQATDDLALGEASVRLEPRWMHPHLFADFAVTSGDWRMEHVRELEGTDALIGVNWQVPDSVRGDWVLFAELTDEAGQTTPVQTFYFTFDNPGPAQVTIDSLQGVAADALPATPMCAHSEPLGLVGEVFDADGLNAVRVYLTDAGGGVLAEWEWGTPGSIACDLSAVDLIVPEVAECTVHVQAVDGSLQPAHARFELQIQ